MVAGDPCTAQGCSACCHGTEMLLSEADLERLQAARPGEPFWMEADDGFLQLRTREVRPRPAQGVPCWFLGEDGRCSVYEDRPEGCRLYPWVWDDEAVLDRTCCPHAQEFQGPAPAQAVRALVGRLEQERDARAAQASG